MTGAKTARIIAWVMNHEAVRANSGGPSVATSSIQIIGDHAMPRIMGRPVFINRFLVSLSGKSFMVLQKKEFLSARPMRRRVFLVFHTPFSALSYRLLRDNTWRSCCGVQGFAVQGRALFQKPLLLCRVLQDQGRHRQELSKYRHIPGRWQALFEGSSVRPPLFQA